MTIEFEWQAPLALRTFSEKDQERVCDALENEPGIYVFARTWGQGFEALYVGQGQKVCNRIKQQFNNRKLITHIQAAKTGSKVLLVGYLNYHGNTNIQKSLNKAEQAFIRYCISENHSIHNKLGTKRRIDEVLSAGGPTKTIFPKTLRTES